MTRTLLDEQFAPTTWSVGYLCLSLDESAQALLEWRHSTTRGAVHLEELRTGFPDCLRSLEPLTGGVRPRELLVEASNGWTAYFDCSIRGTDAVSTVGYLSQAAQCQGLAIRAMSHRVGPTGATERGGALQFELFAPAATDFLNYVRTISLTRDGGRWRFETWGPEQPFEEPSAYKTRRTRDRFTSELLERYCRALNLDVLNAESYGPRAVLVRSDVVVPESGCVMSAEQARKWLGLVPRPADPPG